MNHHTCRILLISGSLRTRSTNTATLVTAREIAPRGIEAVLYSGLAGLPHFNPDDDPDGGPVDLTVAELRSQIAGADAMLFSTPEYAGALPGSFKNLLDWTVGGGETYGKPVAWINVSSHAAPSGGAGAHDSLRSVLGYTGSVIVEDACARIPLSRGAVGPDGLIADDGIRARIAAVLSAIATHVDGTRW
ncbi:MAG: NADPH-dependent FMN reductase [Solirubrobacterales bacterium]|nr:MAG: NADPH-dependent FMN reductase [Solirubrobacterales bacterium]